MTALALEPMLDLATPHSERTVLALEPMLDLHEGPKRSIGKISLSQKNRNFEKVHIRIS